MGFLFVNRTPKRNWKLSSSDVKNKKFIDLEKNNTSACQILWFEQLLFSYSTVEITICANLLQDKNHSLQLAWQQILKGEKKTGLVLWTKQTSKRSDLI